MNCTLITLNLQGNNISDKFIHILENELSQNQSIQDIILPSIKEKGLKRNKYVAEKKRTMTKLEQVEVLPSANANITRHKTHKEVRNRASIYKTEFLEIGDEDENFKTFNSSDFDNEKDEIGIDFNLKTSINFDGAFL